MKVNAKESLLTLLDQLPKNKKASASLNQKIQVLAQNILDGTESLNQDSQGEVILKFLEIKHKGGFSRWLRKSLTEQKIEAVINKYFDHNESIYTLKNNDNPPCKKKYILDNPDDLFLVTDIKTEHGKTIYSGKKHSIQEPLEQIGDFFIGNETIAENNRISLFTGSEVMQGDPIKIINGKYAPELKNATDLRFLELLIGTHNSGEESNYTAPIVLKLLEECDSNNWKSEIEMLKNCIDYSNLSKTENPDFNIIELINKSNKKKELIFLNSIDHAMGILITKKDQDNYQLDIFNSGDGLITYHNSSLSSKLSFLPLWTTGILSFIFNLKFETKKSYTISEKKIEDLINTLKQSKNKTTTEIYQEIQNKSDSVVKQDSPCYQSMQKSGNCSLEWIFAYLKNSNPTHYNALRKEIFSYCRTQLQNKINSLENESPYKERYEKILAELDRKINKREKKQKNVVMN